METQAILSSFHTKDQGAKVSSLVSSMGNGQCSLVSQWLIELFTVPVPIMKQSSLMSRRQASSSSRVISMLGAPHHCYLVNIQDTDILLPYQDSLTLSVLCLVTRSSMVDVALT